MTQTPLRRCKIVYEQKNGNLIFFFLIRAMEQVVKNLIGMKHAFFLIVGQIFVLSGLGFSSSSKPLKKIKLSRVLKLIITYGKDLTTTLFLISYC